MMEQAIALLETDSIAAGVEGGDAMVKTSSVDLLTARPICPGKYMVLIRGEVSQVTNALRAGVSIVKNTIVDQLLLPRVHPAVFTALAMTAEPVEGEALGIIETVTAATCIVAADAAAKAAMVSLLELRLADGLGGKSYVFIQGMVDEVEAAVSAGVDKISGEGLLVRKVVITRLHDSMRETIT